MILVKRQVLTVRGQLWRWAENSTAQVENLREASGLAEQRSREAERENPAHPEAEALLGRLSAARTAQRPARGKQQQGRDRQRYRVGAGHRQLAGRDGGRLVDPGGRGGGPLPTRGRRGPGRD